MDSIGSPLPAARPYSPLFSNLGNLKAEKGERRGVGNATSDASLLKMINRERIARLRAGETRDCEDTRRNAQPPPHPSGPSGPKLRLSSARRLSVHSRGRWTGMTLRRGRATSRIVYPVTASERRVAEGERQRDPQETNGIIASIAGRAVIIPRFATQRAVRVGSQRIVRDPLTQNGAPAFTANDRNVHVARRGGPPPA